MHTDTLCTHTVAWRGAERAPAGDVCGSGRDPVKSLQEINFAGLFS